MGESRESAGVEFDWFAIDQDGFIALFATAGSGPVPASVLASTSAYEAIGGSISVSGFGSSAVWQSYAQAGLYAYDWSGAQASYVRVAEPTAGSKFELAPAVTAIPGLPRLPLSFSKASVISPRWEDGT
jgi:hypothetical protein